MYWLNEIGERIDENQIITNIEVIMTIYFLKKVARVKELVYMDPIQIP